MVLVFALLHWFSYAFAGCDLNVNQLQELRTSLLCSCDDDTNACAILVDAFQRPNTNTLASMVGAAIGTHLNYRVYNPYSPKGRLSQAGLNDWSAVAFKNCGMFEQKELRELLSKSIDEQLQVVNNNLKLCRQAEQLYETFEEPHFEARCEKGKLVASPRKLENTVEHTVIRGPASNEFTHILRSKGGETARFTQRSFMMNIHGKSDSIKYTLNFVDDNNNTLKPTSAEVTHVRGLWQRYRREFVEMTNCCNNPKDTKEACKKYDIKD